MCWSTTLTLMQVIERRLVEAEYLPATRRTYERWVRRYVRHHLPAHPREVGQAGVEAFITHLSTDLNLSATTQNQALDAIRFLYEQVGIGIETAHLRAKVGRRVQETTTPTEAVPVIEALPEREQLVAWLIYGSGLQLQQAAALRIGQVDLVRRVVRLRQERPIARRVIEPLATQIETARGWPGNVDGYVFPSSRIAGGRCWHVSPSSLQKALRTECQRRGLARAITPKVLRASFAAGLLDQYDPRTVQEVLGASRLEPLVQQQESQRRLREVVSPLDRL